jgi:GMP reductase
MVKIDYTAKLDFSQVLITPKRSTINSRKDVDLTRKFEFKNGQTWEGVPIICANMATTGTFDVYDVLKEHKILTCLHKFYTLEDFKVFENKTGKPMDKEYFIVSTGISDKDYENLCNICDSIDSKWICVDIANGYIPNMINFCKKVRIRFPNHILIAGNIATPEMAEALCLEAGVDIIKAGIGPGSVCTTRVKTGVGIPQLSCIMDCADAVHGINRFLIGDGGITCPGDLSKAFCGGADFVMMGGVFAGHLENPGEIIEKNIDGRMKKFKLFYGMSSTHAMMEHYGKKNSYRASEGKVVEIAYKGELKDTIEDYLGGVRSTCTYIGAKKIKHMPKCTTFVMVSNQVNTIYGKSI